MSDKGIFAMFGLLLIVVAVGSYGLGMKHGFQRAGDQILCLVHNFGSDDDDKASRPEWQRRCERLGFRDQPA